jgi:uncharacterized integral membrane protein
MPDEPSTSRSSRGGTAELLRYLPAAILVVVLAAFAIDNRHSVTVGFVFADTKVPLVFVLLATALVGALLGALVRWRRH